LVNINNLKIAGKEFTVSYTIDVLKDKNVVLLTISEGFRVGQHVNDVIRDLTDIFDAASSPMYYVSDTRSMKVSFGDVVSGLATIALPGKGGVSAKPLLSHPNIKEIIIVMESDSSLMKVGSKALEQTQYGAYKVTLFPNLEQVYEYIGQK
jgi:hypothetical protein